MESSSLAVCVSPNLLQTDNIEMLKNVSMLLSWYAVILIYSLYISDITNVCFWSEF